MRQIHMPKISVVIATYNRPKSLGRLLSILENQVRLNMKSLEVVVVDDGSPVELKDFPDYHFSFKYIYRPRHLADTSRVYSSRNIAVSCSTGEYVLQVDDDVTFHERHVSELQYHATFLEFLAPNLHWCMVPRVSNNKDRETSDGMGDDRAGWHRGKDGLWRDGKIDIVPVAWPSTSSCMMFMPKKTWDLVGGYDEEFDGCMGAADQELSLRIAKAGGVLMIGPYFAHIEDEETDSWRDRMIDRRGPSRERNEDLMRRKHPDMDDWSQFDHWAEVFDVVGGAHVVQR